MSKINIKDSLVKTLEDNPSLYEVINSSQHLEILSVLYKENNDFANIKRIVKVKKDIILYNILDTLISRDLVKKINVNDNEIYYITDIGKNLYNLYKNAKEEYTI